MARTYRKAIRAFICTGNNRPWYKARRKLRRHKSKNELREALSKNYIDDIDDVLIFDVDHMPMKNTWEEPTDGHYPVTIEYIKNLEREYKNSPAIFHHPNIEYFKDKFARYLKNKHYKH